jgi:haloalkane dehalogenase
MEMEATSRAGWPYSDRWLDLPQGRIHYVDEGVGPTLLFVHFGPAWSFVWKDAIKELSPWFRCVALDFPGAGASPASDAFAPDPFSASQVLDGFVDRMNLEDVTLVAHDLGGIAGLSTMLRQRARFTGLAVVESFAWSLNDRNPKIAKMLRFVGGRLFSSLNAWTNVLALGTSGRTGVGRHLSRRDKRAFRAPYRDRRVRRAATAALGSVPTLDPALRELERRIASELGDVPVLLVYGQKSPTVKEGFPDRFQELLPQAELVLVPGGHHFPQMDDGPAVASAIRRWMKSHT